MPCQTAWAGGEQRPGWLAARVLISCSMSVGLMQLKSTLHGGELGLTDVLIPSTHACTALPKQFRPPQLSPQCTALHATLLKRHSQRHETCFASENFRQVYCLGAKIREARCITSMQCY